MNANSQMKHLLYSFPLRLNQPIGHSLSLKCTPYYAYASCAVDNKTAQMTLRLQSSKLHLLGFDFFFGCLSGFGFWHTASIKAFKMQSNVRQLGQTDRQTCEQLFSHSLSQSLRQSFLQSVIQLVLPALALCSTTSPKCALHAQKQNYILLKNHAAAHKSTSTQWT